MTRHETFAKKPSLSDKTMVLATDLDGTFLGGTDDDRKRLYSWIEENRAGVGLVFVTGRDPGFIHNLTRREGVPKPDYVIADVGTTIGVMDHNHVVTPMEDLETEIAEAWGDKGPRAQFALSKMRGIKLQSTLFRYRLSYDMDPEVFDAEAARDTVAELGLDTIVSDNRFFDVLPKGISKGPSVLKLMAHLGVANEKVLVAGDTLNDLSMLELGLPAVAVGGSEAALLDALEGKDHVHRAEGIGAAGIAEAILAHGLLPGTTRGAA